MKRKKNSKKISKAKKKNIKLRRNIGLIYVKAVFITKFLLASVLILFFFTAYFSNVKTKIIQNFYQLTAESGFKLKNVVIEGQKNTPELDLLKALGATTGEPILAFNLNKIQANLIKNPWIKEAYVGRRLPDTLYVKLFERRPIAIWQINQQLYLINEEGYKITKDIQEFSHLLQVVGPDANIYAGRLIEELAKYPAINSKSISAVRYGDRRWDLNLDQDITVKMSSTSFEECLEYINALNKADKLFNQNYQTIDLRDNEKHYLEYH